MIDLAGTVSVSDTSEFTGTTILPIAGQMGGAYSQDGTDGGLVCGNPSALQITGDMSFSVWCRYSTLGTASRIFSKYSSTNNDRGYNFGKIATDLFRFNFQQNAGSFDSNHYVESVTAAEADRVYHVCGTFDAGNEAKIYINGFLDNTDSVSIPSSINNSGENFCLGRESHDANWMDGEYWNLRIWDRVISEEEVKRLFYDPMCGSNAPRGVRRRGQDFGGTSNSFLGQGIASSFTSGENNEVFNNALGNGSTNRVVSLNERTATDTYTSHAFEADRVINEEMPIDYVDIEYDTDHADNTATDDILGSMMVFGSIK